MIKILHDCYGGTVDSREVVVLVGQRWAKCGI